MNWLDIIIVIIVVYCIFEGYKTGLIKQLATLAGFIVGAVLSGTISSIILPILQSKIGSSENILGPLSYILAFTAIMIVFYLLGSMIQSIVETVKMGALNRLAGIVLCLAKWIFVTSILLNLILKTDTNKVLITDNTINKSKTFKYVQPFAPRIVPFLKFDLS